MNFKDEKEKFHKDQKSEIDEKIQKFKEEKKLMKKEFESKIKT